MYNTRTNAHVRYHLKCTSIKGIMVYAFLSTQCTILYTQKQNSYPVCTVNLLLSNWKENVSSRSHKIYSSYTKIQIFTSNYISIKYLLKYHHQHIYSHMHKCLLSQSKYTHTVLINTHEAEKHT
ncbi:hypothetical protein NP493_164g02017 [Ridgeia piscesae]|uniref:Uncharacterized protein n=1 Tax=Ridgeia piscesae TaxID=27915 RepID=A0AAD9P3F4_RIDPI|nr:hypothetical protein NP493_164g02017 [Ridgeia piscesae]